MDFYFDIFVESAFAASIIPFHSDPTFFAMRSFGGYDLTLAALVAVLGSTLGAIFNFMLGYLLLKIYDSVKNKKETTVTLYSKYSSYFSKYFIFALFFSFMPLLNFLVIAAGFFAVRARVAIPIVMAGQAARYTYYLIN